MLKNGIDERVKKRLEKLKSGKAKKYFLTNIHYPQKQQAIDKQIINKTIKPIEDLLPELLTLIKLIRPQFKNIWDQNKIVAVYLLLGKTYRLLQSIVDEVKKGNSTSVVELTRSGQEAIDLVFLFLDKRGSKYLDKWFKGQIVNNSDARKLIDKMINEMFTAITKQSISVKEMKSDVYWIYSLYTHSGYGAMLDMVDVYYEDFDFRKYAGFYYTKQYLHLVQNLVVNFLMGIKNIFVYCKDSDSVSRVDKELKKFQHLFATPREIINTQNRYQG